MWPVTIEWREIPRAGPGWPFDDRQVLVLVPNMVGTPWRLGGRRVDPAQPCYTYITRWDREARRWATTETDDDTGGTRWLEADQPVYWAELTLPAAIK
jgi:hypothetical protein